MTKAPELKPCPFCGGNAAIMGGPTAQERWAVWCENGHNMRGGASKEAAIAAWNTRASPSPEAFQQMREALRPFEATVFNDNGDVTISTGHITRADWLALAAALKAAEGK